jgi:hypothetical protein
MRGRTHDGPQAFKQLEGKLKKEDYQDLQTKLLEKGEWWHLQEPFNNPDGTPQDPPYNKPNVVITAPGYQFAAHIQLLPAYTDQLLAGTLLLATAWGAGLSPRAAWLDDDGNTGILRFLPSPFPRYASLPPDFEVVKASAVRKTPPAVLQGTPYLEVQVGELADALASATAYGVAIAVHPQLSYQWASIRLPANPKVSLTEILDRVAPAVGAEWDWSGANILLSPGPEWHFRPHTVGEDSYVGGLKKAPAKKGVSIGGAGRSMN